MSRNYKKGIYTLQEITEELIKRNPGRFKNEASAYSSVKQATKDLAIEDINGKKKYKQIAARDAERILEHLGGKKRRTRAPKKATQVSLFDEGVVDWLEPYTPNHKATAPAYKDEPITADEIAERLELLLAAITDTVDELIKKIKEDYQNA